MGLEAVKLGLEEETLCQNTLLKLFLESPGKDGWREEKSFKEKVDTITGQFRRHTIFNIMEWLIPSYWKR